LIQSSTAFLTSKVRVFSHHADYIRFEA
jgi:magnesium chelatase subunit H